MPKDSVLVLDFGGQYSHLITRRMRQLKVYSELIPFDTPLVKIRSIVPKGIILSGGPASVYDKGAPMPDAGIFALGIPILGICYGLQLTAKAMGGVVAKASKREYGKTVVELDNSSLLFEGLL